MINNEPASPRDAKHVIIGMTLRDYFAGQALCGMVIKYAYEMDTGKYTREEVAGQAYGVADAMLEARKGIS
jgi:hypothetical protein